MEPKSESELVIKNSSDKMPGFENDENTHKVQFSQKTEFIPVTIIEDHIKLIPEEQNLNNNESNNGQVTLPKRKFSKDITGSDEMLKVHLQQHVECSCRHSDDSDSECATKPRSILKHKPNCVVIVHQD